MNPENPAALSTGDEIVSRAFAEHRDGLGDGEEFTDITAHSIIDELYEAGFISEHIANANHGAVSMQRKSFNLWEAKEAACTTKGQK